MSRDEIFNLSKNTMTNVIVEWKWPLEKVVKNGQSYSGTDEILSVTDTQMNAICAAYADYIWAKAQAE